MPMQREAAVEEAGEEKQLAAVSGPLHPIRERATGIKAVAPQKVKFERKAYEVKVYEGELSAEEAFAMGVTKVQPNVNPVVHGQGDEDAWKQKRRQEEIRKEGYTGIKQGKVVKPTKPISSGKSNKKVSSIRDLKKKSED